LASPPPGRVNRNGLQKMVSDKLAKPSRRQIIASGAVFGRIDVADNPSADGSPPSHELPQFQHVAENDNISPQAQRNTVSILISSGRLRGWRRRMVITMPLLGRSI